MESRFLKTLTGQEIEITAAEQIDNLLQAVEQIADKLQGMRAALEDVTTEDAKKQIITGACRHYAAQLQAIADGRAVFVNDEINIFPAKDPGAEQ